MRDEFVSFHALKERFNVTEMWLFSIIQKGLLTPFNSMRDRLMRPDRKPANYIEELERERLGLIAQKINMLTNPQSVNMRFLESQFDNERPPTENEIEIKIKDLEIDIKKYKNNTTDLYNWKNYRFPDSDNRLDELKAFMSICYFKISEIKKISNLFKKREEIHLNDISSETNLKFTRKSQMHRLEAECIAERLWAEDPTLTIAEVIRNPDINKSYDGNKYVGKTLRRWVKSKCPNPRRGRPKKN